jgi:hypothetical protein
MSKPVCSSPSGMTSAAIPQATYHEHTSPEPS